MVKPSYLIAAVVVIFISCSKVPITNRKQLHLLPESQMIAMGFSSYGTYIKENPPVALTDPNAEMVKRIGNKLSQSVIKFLAQKKMSSRIAGYKWEFNLVDKNEANAWCMPGGKVVVFTGLLPITKDENSLAFVMGHEIAHAVAQHGNERMSQQLTAVAGGMALDMYMAQKPAETRKLFNTAYGLGTQVGVMLPFSRIHESEADKLGMIFMALGGYDPRPTPEIWKRMSAAGGGSVPELLSTHPSDANRAAEMRKFMPEAMKYYNSSQNVKNK